MFWFIIAMRGLSKICTKYNSKSVIGLLPLVLEFIQPMHNEIAARITIICWQL